MYFNLPALPFAATDVSHWLSPETLNYHHDRHHRAYVDKLNQLLEGSSLAGYSLEDIVLRSDGMLYDNAAQAWNHTFYWLCMGGATDREGALVRYPELRAAAIGSFGSFENLVDAFSVRAKELFGAGWVWLVKDQESGKLEVIPTLNAGNPIRAGKTPLLACDVWEHAYYIDYRNARAKYVDNFVAAVDWECVARNLVRGSVRDLTDFMRADERRAG